MMDALEVYERLDELPGCVVGDPVPMEDYTETRVAVLDDDFVFTMEHPPAMPVPGEVYPAGSARFEGCDVSCGGTVTFSFMVLPPDRKDPNGVEG